MGLAYNRMLGLFVISAILLAQTGCNLKRGPEDTTRRFMEALRTGDETGVRAVMTRAARERMDKPLNISRNENMQFTVGNATVTDEIAQTPVTIQENGEAKQMTVKLKQDEGEWRVYALRLPVAPGGADVTFDMEHPEALYGDLFRGLGEGMGAMFKGLGEGMGAMLKGLGEGLQKMNESAHTR